MQIRSTKLKLKTFLIYFIFTVVPSLLISYIFTVQKMELYEDEYRSKVHRSSGLHAKSIDNFIGETAGRLEMLATLMKVQHYDYTNMEGILKETHQSDDRFSGLYWSTSDGNILISSITPFKPINISDRAYFQQAIELQKTSISETHHGRITGNLIVTMATPIISENNSVSGVLLASLRLDEIATNIQSLLNDERIVITDNKGTAIIQAGSIDPELKTVETKFKLDNIPWTLTASTGYDDGQLLRNTLFFYFFIAYIFVNILLLLIYNFRLKWKGKLEKEQYEFQKMELIGNLAASTAHEIRNPLTGISGLVKLLSEEYHDKKAQSYFEVIQNEIARINSIVSELLFLGRPTAYTLQVYNINDILKEIEPILQSEANYMNIRLSISYSMEDIHISCVKDHVKQVILNLSKNSLQAMPDGGDLDISVGRSADSCFIMVKDSGVGIPTEEIDKIFQPFFTKKKEGSGIGLTICKRIIESYNGSIYIQSTPSTGTEAKIFIPLIKDDQAEIS